MRWDRAGWAASWRLYNRRLRAMRETMATAIHNPAEIDFDKPGYSLVPLTVINGKRRTSGPAKDRYSGIGHNIALNIALFLFFWCG